MRFVEQFFADFNHLAACIGVMPGDNVTELVIVQVNCAGKSIVDFVSSVPIGMKKSTIQNPSTSECTL